VRYSSEFENLYRQKVFMQNLANINTHNSDPERTYEMGVNQFTAMNKEEFTSQYLGTIVRPETIAIEDNGVEINAKIGEIDWESAGAVTKVKSQGNCGACWAFSAIASVEGLSKIAYGKLTGFSVQQLVDCANSRYGNQGCNGGLIDNGFKYIIKNGVVP
jgi:C1A family cysteine protease